MAIFRPWKENPHALPATAVEAIRNALLSSPLVGTSTLGGSFKTSRGFAVTFKGQGRATLESRFPVLAPFLKAAVKRRANAWYMNLLLIAEGGSINRHVDGTLHATPMVVSVLYLAAPGGELVLSRGTREIRRITPREGTLLHFDGDLDHAVTAFAGPGLRASLVLEQYRLGEGAHARVPDFKLDSRAGFQAYLDAHRTSTP